MFFAKNGIYEACGLFSIGHLLLICITILGIYMTLKYIKIEKESVLKTIRILTILVWVLEIIKIAFNAYIGNGDDLNSFVPLYFCSLLLYAGLMSSFGKGKIKHTGDVFLATGGIIGGIVFIIMPTTSLPNYPMFHFISIHSFLYHGIMVYIGLLIHKTKYISLDRNDIKYYASLIFAICVLAYIVNSIYGSNLMFISQDFPDNPLTILYHFAGPLFTPIMVIIQMTLPFYIIYGLDKLKLKKELELCEVQ